MPVGYVKKGKYYIYNHAQIIVKYHATASGDARVVGVFAEPFSVNHRARADGGLATCSEAAPMTRDAATRAGPLEYHLNSRVVYTYDVVFEPSDVAWASRWDIYVRPGGDAQREEAAVHWFSIGNAILIVLTLGGILALVLARSLRADLARYARDEGEELLGDGDGVDESGWKVLHGDAFRAPECAPLLCVLVASGAQLGCVGAVVFVFAYVGFLSPAQRGGLLVALLATYALLGGLAGYASARLDKATGGRAWSRTTAATATLVPGACGAVFLALDAALLRKGSSGAVPFVALAQLFGAWLTVCVPLVYVGAALGYGRPALEFPAAVARAPRAVPASPCLLQLLPALLLAGVVPFGASFVELYFVLDSIWMGNYLLGFGFAFGGFALLVLAAAEAGALLTYYTLCAENHNWWWRSFLGPATAGAYAYAYAAWYFSANLADANALTAALFFAYMALGAAAVGLVAGAAGFLASLALTRAIFAAVKFD